MPPAKPSLELLRSLTDQHVVRALMAEPRLTRAELATRTGLSKPTVSESVRRLTAAGLLRDTGERTTGRGRVGSYYGLAADVGTALVAGIAPAGVVAEILDVRGRVLSRAEARVARAAPPDDVTRLLRDTARRARREAPGEAPVRLAVVSAADPVDRASGRLVHLPDAPFLVGELSPVAALSPLVAGPVRVDNDVNWAARAERRAATGEGPDDFAYVHLGEGLGCAVVSDGEVRRGHGGIAGEIAHVVTRGKGGRAVHLTEVFAELGLRQAGTTAIDVERLVAAVAGDDARSARLRTALAEAICGVLAAVVAVADPETVVIGGSWGPAILPDVAAAFAGRPRHVPLRAAQVADEPSLLGARQQALDDLREAILALVVMDLDGRS